MPLETLLADSAVKATVLLSAACVAAALLRRASAAARHLLWSMTVVGLLLLPALAVILPAWRIVPDPFQVAKRPVAQLDRPQPPVANDLDPAQLAPPDKFAASAADALSIERESNTPQAVRKTGPVPSPNRGRSLDGASRFGVAASHWIVSIWLAGVVLAMGRLCLAILQVRRLRMRATPNGDPVWTGLLVRLAAQIGRRCPVQLFECDRPCVPMTFGLLRPSILLPPTAAQWSAERRRVVLLHELAHVQRHDCLTHWIGQVAAALYWFHPLVWLAAHRLGIERERACDNRVLACGTEPCAYAEHVVELAAGLPSGSLAAAALALSRRSALEGRLRAILDPHVNRRTPGRLSLTLATMTLCAVVFPLAPLGHSHPSAAGAQPRHPSATQREDASPFDRLDRSQIPPYELAAAGAGDPNAAPAELVAVLGDSRLNHWGVVKSLAFSQDGTALVSAGFGHAIMLWDPATGRALRTLKGPMYGVDAVAVSADRRFIVSAGGDEALRGVSVVGIWNAKNGALLHTLPRAGRVTSLAIGPNAEVVAILSSSRLMLWSLASGKLVRSWPTNRHTHVAFAPPGNMLATATDEQVALWEVETGRALRVLEVPRDLHVGAGVVSLAWSPDGRRVALGTLGGVVFWNAETGAQERTLAPRGPLLCFSTDGRRVATLWDNEHVSLWDAAAGAELVRTGGGAPAYGAAFSPNGETLATGVGNMIRLWDAATGKEKAGLRQPIREILSVAVSRDGSTIAAASRGDAPVINLWDVATREVRRQLVGHTSRVRKMVFSPDGALLASASYMSNGAFKVWDLETGKALWTRLIRDAPITGFAFDPSGKKLICTINGKLQLLAAATGEPIPFEAPNDDSIRGGIWPSVDGKRFATISRTEDEQRSTRKTRIEVWDVAQQQLIRSFAPGRTKHLNAVALSVDGGAVVAALSDDELLAPFRVARRTSPRGMLKEWNVSTGELRNFFPLDGGVRLAVSPNGDTLAAPGADGLLDLIDASSFTLRRTFELGPIGMRLNDIAFDPDGQHLVTANGNGTLYVLRLKR